VTMNHLLVLAHQDALLVEAAAERLARTARESNPARNRLADAVKGVRSFFSVPAEQPDTVPTLTDYPFRS
jgi:hypothetical protein